MIYQTTECGEVEAGDLADWFIKPRGLGSFSPWPRYLQTVEGASEK